MFFTKTKKIALLSLSQEKSSGVEIVMHKQQVMQLFNQNPANPITEYLVPFNPANHPELLYGEFSIVVTKISASETEILSMRLDTVRFLQTF